MNKKTYLIIFLIFIILYICCYYIHPNSIVILQSNINDFELNNLYEKQPIVIEDKIIDYELLINSWFKQNIKETIPETNIINEIWIENKYKYLYINNNSNEDILEIFINNNKNNEDILAIKLYPNQSLIMPFKWNYYIPSSSPTPNIIGIHDYITYFLAFLF